jgi:hypothetical protein
MQLPFAGVEAELSAPCASDRVPDRRKDRSWVLLARCTELRVEPAVAPFQHADRDLVTAAVDAAEAQAAAKLVGCVRSATGCDPRNDRNAAWQNPAGVSSERFAP